MEIVDQIHLENRTTRNAFYRVKMVRVSANGYSVHYCFGAIGTAEAWKPKRIGMSESLARKEYDALVNAKIKNGYNPVAGSPAAQVAPSEKIAEPIAFAAAVATRDKRDAGIPVQLLTEIDEATLATMIAGSGTWGRVAFLQKHDGHRRFIGVRGGKTFGANKLGQFCGTPSPILTALKASFPDGTILDGELLGEQYVAFDCIAYAGQDITGWPFEKRHALLSAGLKRDAGVVRFVPYVTADVAEEYIACLKANRKEGIVVRGLDEPYRSGRHGKSWKFKFLKTCSVVAMEQNTTDKGKASFEVGVYHADGVLRGIGTAFPTKGQPVQIGQVLEMRYRKCARNGRLVETFFLGVRDDVRPEECTHSAIQFFD